MNKSAFKFKKRRALIISIVFGILFMTISLIISFDAISQKEAKDVLATTKDYIGFQDKVNGLITSNIQLLKGYLAYVKTNEDVSEDETVSYLYNLTKENEIYIRNISIVKDTTIIYTYPKEGNESAIGIDLAQEDDQKEVVLRTKNTLQSIIQGPITLVQGGEAFILRMPILDSNNEYWGQVSIVLRANEVLNEIRNYANFHSLDVGIYNKSTNPGWVYGGENILNREPLEFEINSSMMSWRIYALPKYGWKEYAAEKTVAIFFGIFVLLFSSFLIFYALKTNFQIRHNSYHDRLTGLYNRQFLDEYHVMVKSAADRSGHMLGLILVDLNDFKLINDTYGHKAGDLVLKETARLLRKVSRTNEAVFRLGGDEFLIMIPRLLFEEELEVVKNRIEDAFLKSFYVPGYKIEMAASVGTAVYPKNGLIFDEVLHHADTNMYDEKNVFKTKKL